MLTKRIIPCLDVDRGRVIKGVKFLEQKRYKEAINAFLAAARQHPANGQFRHLLGFTYAQDKQLARAWLQFRKSVRFHPNYQPAIRDFLAIWETFRRRGAFNVSQTPQQIQKLIGKPDAQRSAENRLMWEYGFMRINFVDGQLVSIVDPRGLDPAASKPSDKIKIKLDGRSWRLGFRTINRLQSLTERVPLDQTVQNWKELFTVQRLYGMTERDVSPKHMMGQIEQSLKKGNPDIVFEVLASSDNDATFQWRNPGTNGRTAQHEIVRLLAGERDIFRLAYARKVAQLSQQDVEQWRDILQRAQLISTKARGVPDHGATENERFK